MTQRFFASDNNAGVHPAIMQAMTDANVGHAVAYGADKWTNAAISDIRALFGPQAEVVLVYNGTGANVLSLSAAMPGYGAIVCTEMAHIHVDECGAPEKFTGGKLLARPELDGKLPVSYVHEAAHALGVEHHSQPSVVSVTQCTEVGTVYTSEELRELADAAHQYGMILHVDGARIANACAALGTDLKHMLVDSGVDVLSFGGTKNGMMFGEAVVVLSDRVPTEGMKYLRKQGMQLASKMRYIGAQFSAYLAGGRWLDLARHANRMAQKLSEAVSEIDEVEIMYPVQANGVFARVPRRIIAPLQDEWFFYVWDEAERVVRWMCSFDTTEEDIELFAASLRTMLG